MPMPSLALPPTRTGLPLRANKGARQIVVRRGIDSEEEKEEDEEQWEPSSWAARLRISGVKTRRKPLNDHEFSDEAIAGHVGDDADASDDVAVAKTTRKGISRPGQSYQEHENGDIELVPVESLRRSSRVKKLATSAKGVASHVNDTDSDDTDKPRGTRASARGSRPVITVDDDGEEPEPILRATRRKFAKAKTSKRGSHDVESVSDRPDSIPAFAHTKVPEKTVLCQDKSILGRYLREKHGKTNTAEDREEALGRCVEIAELESSRAMEKVKTLEEQLKAARMDVRRSRGEVEAMRNGSERAWADSFAEEKMGGMRQAHMAEAAQLRREVADRNSKLKEVQVELAAWERKGRDIQESSARIERFQAVATKSMSEASTALEELEMIKSKLNVAETKVRAGKVTLPGEMGEPVDYLPEDAITLVEGLRVKGEAWYANARADFVVRSWRRRTRS